MVDPDLHTSSTYMRSSMTIPAAYEMAGFTMIEVEISSLSDYAAVLRREVEENIRPCIERMQRALDHPYFGTDNVLELDDVRDTYDDYMAKTKEFLHRIEAGVTQIAGAAEQVAAKYSEADQFAKIQATDVNAVLPVITPSTSHNRAI